MQNKNFGGYKKNIEKKCFFFFFFFFFLQKSYFYRAPRVQICFKQNAFFTSFFTHFFLKNIHIVKIS